MKSIAFLTSTCLVILMAYPSCAFTLQSPISTTGRHHHATTTQKKQHGSSLIQLSALPPPLTGHELSELHNLLSTSHFLSDASSAVAESSSEGGLWESYLNIFKRSLEFVHSTIDQPLKNVGWDQTWGVSIFLFTVCKYKQDCIFEYTHGIRLASLFSVDMLIVIGWKYRFLISCSYSLL